MKLMESILLPVDFTPSSNAAVDMAVYLGRIFHSEIILLHVVPENLPAHLAEEMMNEVAKKAMEDLRNRIEKEGVKVAHSLLVSGHPVDQILFHALYYDPNVIMLGSGESQGDEHHPLGMTAEKIARKASQPVWVVKRGSPAMIRTILCPVDFSETSRHLLQEAILLAKHLRARLHVLAVAPEVHHHLLGRPHKAAQDEEKALKETQQRLDQFLADFDFGNVPFDRSIRYGRPYQEILGTARAVKADLIFMGAAGKGTFQRQMLGKTAEKVLRALPCSLLILKKEELIRLRLEADLDDLESNLKEGRALVEEGFAREAIQAFKRCLAIDPRFLPAIDGLVQAYRKIGNEELAKHYERMSKEIRERLWQQWVEAEIRRQHTLFGYKKKDM
ncbi:MAG: hypothetical protein D6715_00790 [Calditrichaeota bacterium]|nr:MAG: hypothetical protein D6715_00790 [Calditrichota bacterium]